ELLAALLATRNTERKPRRFPDIPRPRKCRNPQLHPIAVCLSLGWELYRNLDKSYRRHSGILRPLTRQQVAKDLKMASTERYVNEHELAAQLGMRVSTLRKWRLLGRGPEFRRFGRAVRYSIEKIDQWVKSRPSGGLEGGPNRG